jgi:FMN phosphatase YigB (HAD superfamily)
MTKIRAVCFDIGGVLADVAHTWSTAMHAAGLQPTANAAVPFEDLDAFKLYQAGQLGIEAYLDELGDFLGIDTAGALSVHEHILMRPTTGTLEIIGELQAHCIVTGCLSNTNSLHWPVLIDPEKFPNVAALTIKAASQLIGFNKPAAESFRAFETMARAGAAEVLFFEDGPGNVAGALEVGWNAVLVDASGGQEGQIRTALSTYGVL